MKPVAGLIVAILTVAAPVFVDAQSEATGSDLEERARRILSEAPLVDGHNDVPWTFKKSVKNRLDAIDLGSDTKSGEPAMHTDIPRLRQGGVGGQFWSVYVPTSYSDVDAVRQVFEQIDFVHRMTAKYSDTLEMAYTASDIERINADGRIASLIGMEGGHSIGNSLAVLRQTYRAGARYMTLTHSDNTRWADSSTSAPEHDGLTTFGREVVKEMNRLGMLIDLSHVSQKTMHHVLDTTEAPVIFSHSSARALASHPRNVPDDVLVRLPENDGVVMVTFVPPFLSDATWKWMAEREGAKKSFEILHPADPEAAESALEEWKTEHPAPQTSTKDVADHIDHIKAVAGIDHIGIGSDFDGISSTPTDLTGVEDFPNLFAELLRRGYTEEELKKIASQNVLRVFREAERVAVRLSAERAPSDLSIESSGDPK